MKKKKEKKCFISCKMVELAKYQKALNTKYQLMFTTGLEDAEFFIAPMDIEGLTEAQKRDYERAEAIGVPSRFIVESDILLDKDSDPLELFEKDEPEIENNGIILEEDEGFELELI